jgi:hypothetical protein
MGLLETFKTFLARGKKAKDLVEVAEPLTALPGSSNDDADVQSEQGTSS